MTNEQLVDEYGKLAGHIAWDMVRRSGTLGSEDAEDFASSAICRMIQCPVAYRDQPPYVKRIILNSIIKDWRKALRAADHEIPIHLLIGENDDDVVRSSMTFEEMETQA